ncbi:MAG: aryl-sulfate sulfotransferase, partial [Bacteroidales bacterium]|nr:aryl-sulfate sulfotransferase [Bacteroidales bacterium]
MKHKYFLAGLWLLISIVVNAQQWGYYTLYAPRLDTRAYLIDTANTPVAYKTWNFSSQKKTGYSAYLLPGDTLLRTYKLTTTSFNSGGITGGVQKVDWNGNIIWDYTYTSTTYCLHHDICPLPNGNVLMISIDKKTATDASAAGSTSSDTFYSEKIIEVKPVFPNGGVIVWEWKLWDHMCQNADPEKDNYVESIQDNPQLMNINYAGTGMLPDRYHMNGLDYDAELDQIVFSMHFMNSVFIIDHSTTTAEAAGHTGGNSGKGGDFLYRWGN